MRFKTSKLNGPRWVDPNIDDEHGEILRTAKHFGIQPDKLKAEIANSKPRSLLRHVWKKLDNTDSWGTDSHEKADNLAKSYGKDIKKIRDGIKSNSDLPSPIIIKHKNGHYLVGGNTRLMASRAHGITPKVVIADVRKHQK